MLKYALRRLAAAVPLLLLLTIAVFLLAKQMPGDGLGRGGDPSLRNPKVLAEQREKLGYGDPVLVQYGRWLKGAATGDLGRSSLYQMEVSELIAQRLPQTALLAVLALILSYGAALGLGTAASRSAGGWADRLITGGSYLLYAVPTAVVAVAALYLFGARLHWVPVGGTVSAGGDGGAWPLWDRLRHALLPAAVLALGGAAAYTQFLRSETAENRLRPHVTTAMAKGLSEAEVYRRHILRNALVPLTAVVGLDCGMLLGGTVVVENIFSYPGIGTLFLAAASGRDYAVMMGLTLLTGTMVIAGNVLADLLLGWLDPRIRSMQGGRG
ncbi:ABC transporter permease [Paenibacillus spiritus]|uniref:ABC transporter permease n=1 Tax=Paenibacillus spiritus TaxID=2496557 RepID=A0A5J5GAK5_9BACL|nr:ABC transporter permease [Paenibacillus spiritus]KAA9005147.1 ABC transporter permease [Paenibacillus spiritus]